MQNQSLVINTQAGATMSSLEIARLCEKQHKHVLVDIRNMLAELGLVTADFSAVYKAENNQQYDCFNLPRRECDILIAGYSIKYRAAIVDRWQELEAGNHVSVPSSFAEALRLAADQQEQIQQLQITNQHSAMKIDVLEQLLAAGVSAPEFCRRLNGVNTMKVNDFLLDAGWLILATGSKVRWRVASYARDKYMTEKAFEVTPKAGESFTVNNPVLLKAGAKRLVALYMASKLPMKKTWNNELKHDLAGVLEVVK